jgi:hypothetical protein
MTDARLWHPWLCINRALRVMLHTRRSAEAWSVVRVEFKRALALRSEIRRAGWFNEPRTGSTQRRRGGRRSGQCGGSRRVWRRDADLARARGRSRTTERRAPKNGMDL